MGVMVGANRLMRDAVIVCAATLAAPLNADAQSRITFNRDIAPILFDQCASCHRAGEIGGFSLLTYREVRPRAAAIARATRLRAMPPWKPEPGRGDFLGTRRLTDQQIDTVQRWANEGALEGDAADLPRPPELPAGWRLGTPDLVVTLEVPYSVKPTNRDELRNFVIGARRREVM
jgi:mono/diheme cytochrome c family protein